jgi:hypothetical protein
MYQNHTKIYSIMSAMSAMSAWRLSNNTDSREGATTNSNMTNRNSVPVLMQVLVLVVLQWLALWSMLLPAINQYSHATTGTRSGTSFGSAFEIIALGVAAGYGGAHSKVGAGGSGSLNRRQWPPQVSFGYIQATLLANYSSAGIATCVEVLNAVSCAASPNA